MLMASQQGIVQNADGVAAGGLVHTAYGVAAGVSRNADGIAAGGCQNADGVAARRLAVMLMALPQEGWP